MRTFWIQIVGTKDTGKTSLIEELTRELVSRGRRVTYIKHTHVEPTLDSEDTDTARVRAAGAAATVLTASNKVITIRGEVESVAELSFREAAPGDIVLVEGYKRSPGRKIVMTGGDLDFDALEGVVAVVGAAPEGYGGPAYAADQTSELCDLIERLTTGAEDQTWETRLVANGTEVPLNAFVQDVMASALSGMTEALRDVDDADTLEIRSRRIQRKEQSTTEAR
jgi:molybdopterin-guanine dinucleotide biosynthesis protein MobB